MRRGFHPPSRGLSGPTAATTPESAKRSTITASQSRGTSQSASVLAMISPGAASTPSFRAPPMPFRFWTRTRSAWRAAIARVPSVLAPSTTTISNSERGRVCRSNCRRNRSIPAASFQVGTTTLTRGTARPSQPLAKRPAPPTPKDAYPRAPWPAFRVSMAFADRLKSVPLVLEVVPPHRRASAKVLEGFADRVRNAVRVIPTLDALNLPEVIDENHVGRPFYRNLDPRRCVDMVNHDLPVETIVNKVVVHLETAAAVESWLRESLGEGFRNVVLVGGTSSRNRYPGPSVAESNALFRAVAEGQPAVTCGNITIPERPGEVERLLQKTRAGCDFFTSQVLFEPEPVTSVLRAYGERCAAEGLEPATVLLSFAPVADTDDIEFLLWLGARDRKSVV